jgi:RimJ/RimL family protein N-acetyltransferase
VNEMFGWQYYQTPKVGVFPYMRGTPVYRDGMLPFLYTKLKEENKVGRTFCGDYKTMDEFVSYFDRIKTMQVLCEIGEPTDPDNPDGEKKLTPVGFSWIDSPVGVDGARCAMPGEAFFDNASRRQSARDLARLALGYAFNDLRIDIFHGVQLASNIAARNFSIKMGFKEVAIVPERLYNNGKLEDARVMMLRAEDYLPGFWLWLENAKNQIAVEREPVIA